MIRLLAMTHLVQYRLATRFLSGQSGKRASVFVLTFLGHDKIIQIPEKLVNIEVGKLRGPLNQVSGLNWS